MTTPEREGLLGDIIAKLNGTTPEDGGGLDDVLDDLSNLADGGGPRPQLPEDPADEDVDAPLVPGHPLTHHDSERLLPPPVAGTID